MFPPPEGGDFVELLLKYFCAGMSCPFFKKLCFPAKKMSDSHALDRRVASLTCQLCTTTSTMLAAWWQLEFAVARICYLTLKYQATALYYCVAFRSHTLAETGVYEIPTKI
jgi:hypothetical protein